MSTIKLSTAYQLVLTSLLLGASLGIVGQQLPLTFAAVVPSVRAMVAEELPATADARAPGNFKPAHPALTLTTIVGHDTQTGLWLVCCQDNQLVWLASQGSVQGNMTPVAFVAAASDASAEHEAMPARDPIHPMADEQAVVAPAPTYAYTLVQQQQYREQVTPRIFLYVSDSTDLDQQEGLANLALRVKKDGVELVTTARTHSGQPDFTWPVVHERQQLANLKLEFPHIAAPGLWELQLIDADGQAVGPMAQFIFAPNEPNREIYLHYQKQ